MITPEEQAERLLQEIERKFPPNFCSLDQYRAVLRILVLELRERIALLDKEIGEPES